LTLTDASGKPLTDVSLTFTAEMLETNMGALTASLNPDEQDADAAKLPTTSGTWRVTVLATRADGKTTSFAFLVPV
jgi:hypothetical protein